MSSTLVSRLLLAALFATGLCCAGVALAGAASVEELVAGQLIPSDAPALLGPITASGRKGWECKPERAAMATGWHSGELPAGPASP